jgi:hypothetical protein
MIITVVFNGEGVQFLSFYKNLRITCISQVLDFVFLVAFNARIQSLIVSIIFAYAYSNFIRNSNGDIYLINSKMEYVNGQSLHLVRMVMRAYLRQVRHVCLFRISFVS